jgi:hypothetical protein
MCRKENPNSMVATTLRADGHRVSILTTPADYGYPAVLSRRHTAAPICFLSQPCRALGCFCGLCSREDVILSRFVLDLAELGL